VRESKWKYSSLEPLYPFDILKKEGYGTKETGQEVQEREMREREGEGGLVISTTFPLPNRNWEGMKQCHLKGKFVSNVGLFPNCEP
jgi:hypothetical protein